MMSSTSVSTLELAADAETQGSQPSGTVLPWIDKARMLDTFCYTIGTERSAIAGSTKTAEEHALAIADEIRTLEGTCKRSETACTYTDLLDKYNDPTGVYAQYMRGENTTLHQPSGEIIREMVNITLKLKEHHDYMFHSRQPSGESGKIEFPYKFTQKDDETETDTERPSLIPNASVRAGLSLGRTLAAAVGAVQEVKIWATRQGRSVCLYPCNQSD
jgi:hypothetical protein